MKEKLQLQRRRQKRRTPRRRWKKCNPVRKKKEKALFDLKFIYNKENIDSSYDNALGPIIYI